MKKTHNLSNFKTLKFFQLCFILIILSNLNSFLICHYNVDQYQEDLQDLDNDTIFDLSLKELMDIKVTTASKITESLNQSPANMLVITNQEIKTRGYHNLVEIFQDLPGIDLSIAYADTYYKTYWRGFRTGMADSWVLLIDGMVMNHLWYNYTNVLISTPLSNIEQIEVVYGPTSVVYGANAMTGVVNIITKKNSDKDGLSTNINLMHGSFKNNLIDMSFLFNIGDLKLSLTAFYNQSDLDQESLERFEYTKSKYLKDTNLWGAYLNNSTIAGTSNSVSNNRSFEFKAIYNNLEFGWLNLINDNSYGINYPFDKMQVSPKWIEPDNEYYLKYNHEFNENFYTTSLIRYRTCDVSNESTSLEASGDYGKPQTIAFGYWQSLNRSFSVNQDLFYKLNDFINFQSGFKYERKELQRAYDLVYGDWLSPKDVKDITQSGLFPEPYDNTFKNEKHDVWIEESIYLQSKFDLNYLFNSNNIHLLNIGFRHDNSSYFGNSINFRAGYVSQFNNHRIKLLYGEAYKEPAARQLFGGWAAIASNPNLKPENSKTIELEMGHSTENIDISINPYYNQMRNMIMEINKISINHGEMSTYGFDISFQTIIKSETFKLIKFWAYYSFTETLEDKFKIIDTLNLIIIPNGSGIIGDIAKHKIHAGINLAIDNYSLLIKARYIGNKQTVESNPIRNVDAYFTADLNFIMDDVLANNLALSFKITNFTNTFYYQSGIRKANSGDTPGYFEGENWYGSQGFYNSLLPQPGIGFYLGFNYKL